MTIKIDKKITNYEVVDKKTDQITENPLLERDGKLKGSTYKIKTPASDHAMYITINNIVINQGQSNEHSRPFEIFINSKNMEQFMWISSLTRVISAIFRKGGDIVFLVEELKAVFDPRGGYFKKGGKYMPSVVSEIGEVLERHLKSIGMIEFKVDSEELVAKRKEAEIKLGSDALSKGSQCDKCGAMAVVRLDNCNCCLECGDSKCG